MKRHQVASVIAAGTQRGFVLLVAVVLIVIAALILSAMVFMSATATDSGDNHLQSGQGLYISDSGLEYEQRQLAQNVDWYRATANPFDNATINVGQGSATISTYLPATELRTQMIGSGGGTTAPIKVFATAGFPSSGTLLIDDDPAVGGELVNYTGTNTNTFGTTSVTRNVNFGSLTAGSAGGLGAHARGSDVYPVVALGVALSGASCATIPNPFTIAAHARFLTAGTVTVFHYNGTTILNEEITYSNSTTSGGTLTLLGVQRCQYGTGPISAAAGDPVTPLVAGVGTTPDAPDIEARVVSVGAVSGTQRTENKTVQRQLP